ncbi:methyl-accepting chemotaxis protein [Celerinatantimonas sp. MCCC 1A17872]|uniref:methyl-accepting chemotaxis protein n=1 Tax=Celerinatantimonas sp. MCCC 1A17872 TaxID=3177514 RepID=UPI0038C71F5E
MNFHSIRIKMMLPILLLAAILAGLSILMLYMNSEQKKAMIHQSENYFEAISVVLNADRDLYQARLAQEQMLTNNISDKLREDFDSNAQQVLDRFQKYRQYLSSDPKLLAPFASFDERYKQWLDASHSVMTGFTSSNELANKFAALDEKFLKIRSMLDVAGEKLRTHTRAAETKSNVSVNDIERYVEAVTEVLNADRDIYQARLAQQQIINGVGDFAQNLKTFDENAQQVIARFNSYRSHLASEPELTANYSNFDMLFNEWYQQSQQLLGSPLAKQRRELPESFKVADQKFGAIRELLDQAGDAVRKHARDAEKQMLSHMAELQHVALVVMVVAFIVALAFGFYVPRKLTNDIENVTRRIKEIAEGDGDLTQRINSNAKDELGSLAHQFDDFVERLRVIIRSVSNQSNALGGMTDSLGNVSDKAKNITHSLVKTSEYIVSAANEMTMSNQQMEETARTSAEEVDHSMAVSKQGQEAVVSASRAIESLSDDIEKTLTRSSELEQSSSAISSVLEVIRTIAEQTNLLALNAAIEAARAGEQGRGFAVVADEVRTLATRTQDSTNEIETIIDQLKNNVTASSNSIQGCRKNADGAIATFNEVSQIFNTLSGSFQHVQEMVQQTAQGASEQSTVSQSIMHNLLELKEQTDGVEEVSNMVSSHSEQIQELFRKLNSNVGSFKV